jgi:hypothetical protein
LLLGGLLHPHSSIPCVQMGHVYSWYLLFFLYDCVLCRFHSIQDNRQPYTVGQK